MSVELLRAQTAPRTAPRIDPNCEIVLLISLLGLTLTLAVLPFIGGDLGTSLALAG